MVFKGCSLEFASTVEEGLLLPGDFQIGKSHKLIRDNMRQKRVVL